jgi:hypothetical protein
VAGGRESAAHAHGTDSAGQPWAGRHFDTNSFAGDSGEAPQRLIEVLTAFARGGSSQSAVLEAIRDVRLLVPLVAHAGEMGVDEHGKTFEKTQELSLVTVTGPDGRRVLPVFTSTEAMSRWNPKARPIPAQARRIALAAVAEDTPLLVLDPVSDTEFAFRRAMLQAIAEGSSWRPPTEDPAIRQAFAVVADEETAIVGIRLEEGDARARLAGPEVVVVLQLKAGLDSEELASLLGRVQSAWQHSALIAEGVDSLGIRLVAAASQ